MQLRLAMSVAILLLAGMLPWATAVPYHSTDYTWGVLADMPTARLTASGGMSAANGKITVVAHHEGNPGTGRINEEYDPATDSWASKSPYPQSNGRVGLGNAVLNGEIYYFGGNNVWNNYSTQNVNKYNPATDVWTPDIAVYPAPVSGVNAAAYDGAIYLFGGQNYNSPQYTESYRFDPNTGVFTPLQDMLTGRVAAMAFVVDDKIWLVGGNGHIPGGSTEPIRTTDIYDPATDTWTPAPGLLPDARIRWAGILDNGEVYAIMAGGFPELYWYRMDIGDWELVSTAPLPQEGFGAVSIGNRIHLIGGGVPFTRLHQVVTVDTTLTIEIDIKPGSDPNCFNNNGNGVIPVALLGSATFQADQVDVPSIELAGMAVRVVGKKGNIQAHLEDVNYDGFVDLVVQIEDEDGVFELGAAEATLTGSLLDGTAFEGVDAICIVQ